DARAERPADSSSRKIQSAARRRARDKAARREKAARAVTRQTLALPPLILRVVRQARAVSLVTSFHVNMVRRERLNSTPSLGRLFSCSFRARVVPSRP